MVTTLSHPTFRMIETCLAVCVRSISGPSPARDNAGGEANPASPDGRRGRAGTTRMTGGSWTVQYHCDPYRVPGPYLTAPIRSIASSRPIVQSVRLTRLGE